MQELKEKIEYEFHIFFLDQMRTSRENIFASSEEITVKKFLTEQLYLLADELEEKEKRQLLFTDNVLSSLYCYYKMREGMYPGIEMKTLTRQWLESLKKDAAARK